MSHFNCKTPPKEQGSSGCRVVKLLTGEARGPGFNSRPRHLNIQKLVISYEAEFIQSLLSAGRKRLASQFNCLYRYIDDVLSINNLYFEKYLGQMYPPELEIKDTTESNTSASYLDVLLSIDRDGQTSTTLTISISIFKTFHS